jgi:hypothetical protein
MRMSDVTVFVLGAGFTKAFFPEAPLLTDPYPLNNLLEKYSEEQFPHAHRILTLEIKRSNATGRFDLERLMTRLDSSMPHDFDLKAVQLVEQLRHDLYDDFVKKLLSINEERRIPQGLGAFAKSCIDQKADLITFNYDDFLDQALWGVAREYSEPFSGKYWHPNSGYGFFCSPSENLVQGYRHAMGHSSTLLLKLHGSINWRIKRGAAHPFQLDTILHGSPWSTPSPDIVLGPAPEVVERHLEGIRFLVLPVLMKSDLTNQPCFRLLWSEAYNKLQRATRVVFIGYSMPRTDIAAACLFGEALQNSNHIEVVSYAEEEQRAARELLITAYQTALPQLTKTQFHFEGAIHWLKQNHFIP